MSNIEEYTKNFKFIIPEFNVATWHTEIKENFKAIDALIANFVQSQQYKGAWKQVTSYLINDLVYISDEDSDYYGYLMRVKVNHTTTGDDFDTFLVNNPTYYEIQGEMGAQIAALRAQDWAEKTDGKVVINEVPIDYSAKAYAIGGTGTETNNSKYFKEQAELARDTILEDPGFIVIKADFLGDETIKTVAENIQHVQNIDANLQSVVDVSTYIEDVNTLASNIAAVLTNSANISSINTNAINISNINNVSSNMSDVNNCSDNMTAIQDAPTQAANAAQSAQTAVQAALSITNGYDLFDHKWSDHLLNDQNWLKADTFSWQDGTVYSAAYQHLVDDSSNGTSQTETIAGHTITYILAPDGHKIVSSPNASAVEGLYNDTGVAWYYILDLVNQKFKLPRTKYGFTGLRDTVGKYVPAGLPDHNHYYDAKANHGYNGSTVYEGFWGNGDAYTGSTVRGTFSNASSSNSIYGNSTTVQPPATQMYLYFYVGQYTQTATEQTAGLNSELFNGKLDLDASNLSTQGKSLVSGLGMPSNNYEDLTLGASGTTYTAPANGYYTWQINSTATNQYFGMQNTTSGYIQSFQWTQINGGGCHGFIPARKGDVCYVAYTATNVVLFRFVYAKGEE